MIVFAMDRVSYLSFNVTVESTIDRCIVDMIGFKIREYDGDYFIGDINYRYELPAII